MIKPATIALLALLLISVSLLVIERKKTMKVALEVKLKRDKIKKLEKWVQIYGKAYRIIYNLPLEASNKPVVHFFINSSRLELRSKISQLEEELNVTIEVHLIDIQYQLHALSNFFLDSGFSGVPPVSREWVFIDFNGTRIIFKFEDFNYEVLKDCVELLREPP